MSEITNNLARIGEDYLALVQEAVEITQKQTAIECAKIMLEATAQGRTLAEIINLIVDRFKILPLKATTM